MADTAFHVPPEKLHRLAAVDINTETVPACFASQAVVAQIDAVLGLVVHRRRPLELEERHVRRAREREALRRHARGRHDGAERADAIPREYAQMSAEELDRRIAAARAKLGERVVILGHHYQRDEIIKTAR